MSENNIQAFFEKASQDPVLEGKLRGIAESSSEEAPIKLAFLSEEIGTPVTAEEFRALAAQTGTLSEEELSNVSGGAGLILPTFWGGFIDTHEYLKKK